METIKAGEVSLEPGFLERIRAQPACTERELVDRAIKFANSGSVKSYFNFAGQLAQPYQDDEREPDSPDFLKKKRYSLRSALTAIVERQITVERMRTWCRIASGVVPVASYSVDGDEVRTTFHYQEGEHFWGPEPDG